MRTVQLKSKTVLRSRNPLSTLFLFLIIADILHGVPNFARCSSSVLRLGTMVAERRSGCLSRRKRQPRWVYAHLPNACHGGLSAHACFICARVGLPLGAVGNTVIPAAAAERLTLARAKHARDGRP